MNKTEIISNLSSPEGWSRLVAAREIGRQKLKGAGENLYMAWKREKENHWNMRIQADMLNSLGLIRYKGVLNDLEGMFCQKAQRSMLTVAASKAYVRLKRKNLNDAGPVLEMLATGELSLMRGALEALGQDQMVPSAAEIERIFSLSKNLHQHSERPKHPAFSHHLDEDPRLGLVAACANWSDPMTEAFLKQCIKTGDLSMRKAAEMARKTKKAA